MFTEPREAVPASRGGVVTALLLLVVVGAVTLLTLRAPARSRAGRRTRRHLQRRAGDGDGHRDRRAAAAVGQPGQ